jgi:hypothetical protein
MNLDSLIAELPEQVRYERRELPAEQNALGPWLAASEAIVDRERTDRACSDVVYRTGACVWEECELAPLPPGEERAELDKLLAKNESALRLVDEGLARSRLQLPSLLWPEIGMQESPIGGAWRTLAKMRATRTELMLADGDVPAAATEAAALFRMGVLCCAGERWYWEYVASRGARNSGLHWMNEVAAAARRDETIMRRFTDEVEWASSYDEGQATALRVEACNYVTPIVAALASCSSGEKLVEWMLKNLCSDEPVMNAATSIDDLRPIPEEIVEARRATRRRQMLILLAEHPRLLDPEATMRRAGQLTAAKLAQLASERPLPQRRVARARSSLRWRIRRLAESRIERAWPVSLRLDTPLDYLGDDALATAARANLHACEGMPRWYIRGYVPHSDRSVRRYAARLRKIDNPVGEVLASFLAAGHPQGTWDYREQLESTWRAWNARQAA